MRKPCAILALLLSGLCAALPAPAQAAPASEQEISDAYLYLLGRLLVVRQQQRDFTEGFKWNEIVHRKLEYGADGSLTLWFADQKPADAPEGNWLPTPEGTKYRLTFRFYRPVDGVANGTYYPSALVRR
jgi:hypothetical protein